MVAQQPLRARWVSSREAALALRYLPPYRLAKGTLLSSLNVPSREEQVLESSETTPRRMGLWVVVVGLLLLAVGALGEEPRSVSIVDASSPALPAAVRASHGFDPAESAGLFVGIRDFRDRAIDPIPYAVDDAVDLAHLFSLELGLIPVEKVTLCLAGEPEKPESKQRLAALRGARTCNAEKIAILEEVRRLETATNSDGLVVVALASHGFSRAGADTVVAVNSLRDLLPDTGLSFSTLLDLVGDAGAPRRLVLVDACRERLTSKRGSGQDPTTKLGQGFLDAMERARGTAVLMGTVLGGYSYNDHDRQAGVFTAAVIDGLRGEAPANEAGLITVGQLGDFVNERVAAWVHRKQPTGASQSPGITRILDETSKSLPLAISPSIYAGLAEYRQRRDAALQTLGGLVAERKITGRFFDELVEALEPEIPSPERQQLLAGIESSGESAWAVRGLESFFEEHRVVLLGASLSPVQSAGDVMVEPVLDMRFRYIPAGTFVMGSPEDEEGHNDGETQHEVTLIRGFWMGETEVTQGQWRTLMGSRPSYFSECGDSCPVERVSWYEAVAFANKVSERAGLPFCYRLEDCSGHLGGGCSESEAYCAGDYRCNMVESMGPTCRGYRLATESEWEWAARAGTAGSRHGSDLGSIAWNLSNSGSTTRPAGGKISNTWGLHDMLGNVYEWTWDWKGAYPTVPQQDPVGPQSGSLRVLRGCSWFSFARVCRSAYRNGGPPGYRDGGFGFRLVRQP